MKRPTAIVATTIFEPAFVPGFFENLRSAGRLDECDLYIIPDHKTPASIYPQVADFKKQGLRIHCPTIPEQDAFLTRIGAPTDFIPYNSDNRRNVGYLMALEAGCEVLISIDDDNFILPGAGDFVGDHHVVGRSTSDPVVTSSDHWFNIVSLLAGWPGEEVYPRGFPYSAQRQRSITMTPPPAPTKVAMNAGLWLDEPDVDAVYRLCRRPKIKEMVGQSVVLGPNVWSPINTQNTALDRQAGLIYYYVRMGFPLKGLSIDRFGDILSGYLTQKVVKHLGLGVRVGSPLLDHRRSPHNLFKDLYHELAGIVLIEEFIPWLIDLKLTGSTTLDAYANLADAIEAKASDFTGFIWSDGGQDFLRAMAGWMKTWLGCVRRWS